MKTKLLFLVFFLVTGIVMGSCNQQGKYRPEAKIVSSLHAKYPQASRIDWEQKHGYVVAEFHEKGMEHEAWFNPDGKWIMTESNIKYSALPMAIRTDFEKGAYAQWKKDDIDKIERTGMPAIYILEVESAGKDADLYYTENGNLVKVLADGKKGKMSHYMPLSQTIKDKIMLKYPNAIIIEADTDKGMTEIDIVDNGKAKEVMFNGNNEWISTSWEINKMEIPAMVSEALAKSEYRDYKIDDVHFVEKPDSSYYWLELEKGGSEIHLAVSPDGMIIK